MRTFVADQRPFDLDSHLTSRDLALTYSSSEPKRLQSCERLQIHFKIAVISLRKSICWDCYEILWLSHHLPLCSLTSPHTLQMSSTHPFISCSLCATRLNSNVPSLEFTDASFTFCSDIAPGVRVRLHWDYLSLIASLTMQLFCACSFAW